MSAPSISVVVPTWNEEEFLGPCLQALVDQSHVADEIIVIDGGSTDETAAVAASFGKQIRFLLSPMKGRKLQMNWGASRVRSEFVLFCHADNICEPSLLEILVTEIQRYGLVGGGCHTHYEPSSIGLKLTEALGNGASRFTGMFGSSRCMFMRLDLFKAVGGFDLRSAEEGYDTCRKLLQFGPLRLVNALAITSGRRFSGQFWKTFLSWFVFVGSAVFGIPGQWAEKLFYK